MSATKQVNELAERRRLLVLEADLHRTVINLECESLRARLAGLRAARERMTVGKPWLVAGGTVAGWLALRHWRKVARWAPTLLTALHWVKSLKAR